MKAFLFPGQGSQRKGMGADLFARFPEWLKTADAVLGYSVAELCLDDPRGELDFTAFTQPAIYVVSVLGYLDAVERMGAPDFLAGHSIGEYAALAAAQVFDFETGLRIVQRRAALMAEASEGGLAAILGLSFEEVWQRIGESGLDGIEVANINTPTQIVVGGWKETLQQFARFCAGQSGRVIPLRVSGAFHTSHMRDAQARFRAFLEDFAFREPSVPVISNLTGEPHEVREIADNLSRHLANPVRWTRCVERLMEAGADEFFEIGTARILSPMVAEIRSRSTVQAGQAPAVSAAADELAFCQAFGCTRPLVAGTLGHGISGVDLVSALARGGVLAFLDTEGLELAAVDEALSRLSADPEIRGRFGAGLAFNPDDSAAEERLVDLFLRHSVRCIEVRGYAGPSPALRRYRSRGGADTSGRPWNRVIARIADVAAAEAFLQVPEYPVDPGDPAGAVALRGVPAVDALCIDVQAWRSIGGATPALLSEVLDKRDAQFRANPRAPRVFAGASGPVVSARSVRDLLAKGADFVVAGSAWLIVQEAQLDAAIKSALRTHAPERFREIPDWWFPELATVSWCYVEHEDVAQQSLALQELYLADAFAAASLRDIMARYSDPRHRLLSDTFLAGCEAEAMDAIDVTEARARLRRALNAFLYPKAIACDTPLAELNAWLETQEHSPSGHLKALGLADLLYPVGGAHPKQS